LNGPIVAVDDASFQCFWLLRRNDAICQQERLKSQWVGMIDVLFTLLTEISHRYFLAKTSKWQASSTFYYRLYL
jgi:hypothetical protein